MLSFLRPPLFLASSSLPCFSPALSAQIFQIEAWLSPLFFLPFWLFSSLPFPVSFFYSHAIPSFLRESHDYRFRKPSRQPLLSVRSSGLTARRVEFFDAPAQSPAFQTSRLHLVSCLPCSGETLSSALRPSPFSSSSSPSYRFPIRVLQGMPRNTVYQCTRRNSNSSAPVGSIQSLTGLSGIGARS